MAVSKATNESIMDIMYMYTICTKKNHSTDQRNNLEREIVYQTSQLVMTRE